MDTISSSNRTEATVAARPRPAPPPERLRVLVVGEVWPFPAETGAQERSWQLLRRLAARHEVVFLRYGHGDGSGGCGDAGYGRARAAMTAAGIECHTAAAGPRRAGWRRALRRVRRSVLPWTDASAGPPPERFEAALLRLSQERAFDLIQFDSARYAFHLGGAAPPHLIAIQSVAARSLRQRAALSRNPAARLYRRWKAARMRHFESRAFRRARAVTTVSAEDWREALEMGAARAMVVANGVDMDFFQPRDVPPASDQMLFLGALDQMADQDAVAYFARRILPGIRRRRPRARLSVVGSWPPAWLRQRLADGGGIDWVGPVRDVRPWIAAAALVVAPLRVGGGSRIAVLETLAMEKAVVASRTGAEGLEVHAGTHLLIADTAAAFTEAAAGLLGSFAQTAQLGLAGRRWVGAHHSWDDGAQGMESAWRQAAAGDGERLAGSEFDPAMARLEKDRRWVATCRRDGRRVAIMRGMGKFRGGLYLYGEDWKKSGLGGLAAFRGGMRRYSSEEIGAMIADGGLVFEKGTIPAPEG